MARLIKEYVHFSLKIYLFLNISNLKMKYKISDPMYIYMYVFYNFCVLANTCETIVPTSYFSELAFSSER